MNDPFTFPLPDPIDAAIATAVEDADSCVRDNCRRPRDEEAGIYCRECWAALPPDAQDIVRAFCNGASVDEMHRLCREAAEWQKAGWQKVVLAPQTECGCCGEPWCSRHKQHYAECPCIGPHQDEEYEYTEREGVLYARPKE